MADHTGDARVHHDDLQFTNHSEDTLEEMIAAVRSLADAYPDATRVRIASGNRSIELERTPSKYVAPPESRFVRENALTDISDDTDEGDQQPRGRHRREASGA